ncbi:hypothetical protein EDM53_02880 [Rickettsiales endosymbiont of Peranema trichophorum]|uniref:hypothetical protein n=1 Tax=Rickettsiales endosymbiont of Peranema trichophorum TaxID=2486577 RepID=UPI0010232ED3|nr:hypothetical protein [Rickettsiales endosymbiont of Peranema trichophorum]RZI47243.1 hypothetical protein EDM53_02880 [Rickettsiales endosymbiont of Peranema trichophorum]
MCTEQGSGVGIVVLTSALCGVLLLVSFVHRISEVAYSIYLIGALLLLYHVLYQRENIEWRRSQGLIALVLIIIVYYLRVGHSYYTSWDDFTYWGPAINTVIANKGIAANQETMTVLSPFYHYPMLTSVFNCFMAKVMGFTEGNMLFASGLLSILFLGVLLVENSPMKTVVTVTSVLAVCTLYNTALRSLYPDSTLGIIFGVTLSIYIQVKNKVNALLCIGPLLFVLPQIKVVGFWLAYAGVGIILIDMVMRWRSVYSTKLVFVFMLIATIPAVSQGMWYNHIKFDGAVINQPSYGLGLEMLWAHLSPEARSQEDMERLSGFLQSVAKFSYTEGTVLTYVLVIFSVFLVIKYRKEDLVECVRLYCILFVFFVLYLCFRCSLYFSHFSYEEAVSGASGARYYSTFFTAFSVVAATYIRRVLIQVDSKELRRCTILSAILFVSIISYRIYSRPYKELSEERKYVKYIASKLIAGGVEQKDIDYTRISPYGCNVLRYELYPHLELMQEEYSKCAELVQLQMS